MNGAWSKDYIRDGGGYLVATENASGPCATCYLTTDHLGSGRAVIDGNGTVGARHDYLPYGEEIPANTAGRDGNFGSTTDVTEKFTGQERDAESGMDYFNARYYTPALGRFNSPDPGNAAADLLNPQSWNGYAYVMGNPLIHTDPSGMSCVTLDDGDGQGCAAAGVSPGDPTDPNTLNQGQVNATATAQNPSNLEYLWTISTNQIPTYISNDVPLSDNATQIFRRLSKLIDDYPTICGGGTYGYAGRELDAGPVSGFVGAISENDSRAGSSKGALVESGGGEGLLGGLGYIASTTGGQPQSTGLAYVGLGAKSGVLSGSVGLVGFGSGSVTRPKIGGVGVYGEGSLSGRGGGVGVYANVTRVGSCK